MLTISDLYKNDVPEDSVFVLEYPSSFRENFGNPAYLVNSSRYLLDDEYRDHDYESNRLEKPHRNLAVFGCSARAYVAEPPMPELVEHWKRRLGAEAVNLQYADLGEPVPHVVLFPLQDLPTELHAVDPDVHYHVYSKQFIGEINCPQAAILNEVKYPCVLKVSRSSGGHGTWIIRKEEDYEYWTSCINSTMPYAETVLTELVEDIRFNFCCHAYVNRSGDIRWIGVTEKIMDDSGIWIGAVVELPKQRELERLTRPTAEPVIDALHAKGYFGLVGVDVLVDTQGKQYVIDINPRILGSTPLILASMALQKRGWDAAIFLTGVPFKDINAEALISRADSVKDGEAIIYSIIQRGSELICQIGVFAKTLADCKIIGDNFYWSSLSFNFVLSYYY